MFESNLMTRRLRHSILLALAGASATVSAQEAGGRASQQETALLSEIVVSAQRREARLQDVSVSVTALTGEQLDQLGVRTVENLLSHVPNVSFRDTGVTPQYTIRGTALNDFGDGNESPVAVYVDDIYQATVSATRNQLFDVERVEVLRGPQGTLFGRNATGGVIQFISREPTADLEGVASLRVGSYGQRIVDAALSGPLSERVRGRIAVNYNEDDGYQDNLGAAGSEQYGKTDSLAGRARLAVDFSESVEGLLTLAASQNRGNFRGYNTVGGVDPATGLNCAPDRLWANACRNATGVVVPAGDNRTVYALPSALRNDLDVFTAAARINWTVAPDVVFTSITGYQRTERYLEEWTDGTGPLGLRLRGLLSLGAVHLPADYFVTAKQFTQEFRLGGTRGATKYLVGAFYMDDAKDPLGTVDRFSAFPVNRTDATLDTRSWAAFAQIDQGLTETVTASLGVRYTSDSKDLWVRDSSGASTTRDVDASKTTGRAALEWRPSSDALLFAAYSTGFKSPEFSISLAAAPFPTLGPVGEETVKAGELGSKLTLLDGRATLNATLFYQVTEDKQSRTAVATPAGGFTSQLLNIGDVKAYGGELEFAARPISGLTVQFGAGYTHTEVDTPGNLVLRRTWERRPIPIDGGRVPGTPDWTLNGLVRYDIPSSVGVFGLQLEARWQSDMDWSYANNPWEVEDSYGLLNANLSWESSDRRYAVDAFVENLTNEEYANLRFWIDRADQPIILFGKPRWYGLRGTLRF